MTALGVAFAILYLLGAIRGRKAFLVTLAFAVPFNDSAMIIVSGVGVSPFYVGLSILAASELWSRLSRGRGSPSPRNGLLAALLIYCILVTAIGPWLFDGIGVVASGIGLDSQVDNLAPLQHTSSNLAQIGYLALLVFFVGIAGRDLPGRFVPVGLSVGVLVAASAYFAALVGFEWPHSIFDNSPRGFYAGDTGRLRGQFAEPSHLGVFALTATLYFGTRAATMLRVRGAALSLALAGVSIGLLIASASGTAYVGGLVAMAVVGIVLLFRLLRPGGRISLPILFVSLCLLIVAFVSVPSFVKWFYVYVESKQGSTSFHTRDYANANALDLLTRTYTFGVGLGSNRASSLFFMLLSTVGIVGTVLFGTLVFRAVRRAVRAQSLDVANALIGFSAAAAVSIADFVSPVMWSLICVGWWSDLQLGKTKGAFELDQGSIGLR